MPTQLSIPKDSIAGLAGVLALSQEALDSILAALESARPQFDARALAREIEGLVPIERELLEGLMSFVATWYALRYTEGLSADDFADQLIEAMREAGDSRLEKVEVGWPDFKQWLARLLSLDRTVGVTAKAAFLLYWNQRSLIRARILTDARPVFPEDVDDPPAAFVVNHTLKLDVREEGKEREWFVNLDSADLESLQMVIRRAQKKEQSLRRLLDATSVPILSWKEFP